MNLPDPNSDSQNQPAAARMTLDESNVSWEVLTEHVESFLNQWEAWNPGGDPPSVADALPSEPNELRDFVLVELIKVDLDYRSKSECDFKRLEDYLKEFPSLADHGELPTDLIFEEFQVRRAAGENVEPSEYFERFPQQSDVLRRLLQIDSPTYSVSLVGTKRPPEVEAGEVIDDDFQLLVELGKGAFGSVFLARQLSMQRLVALKLSGSEGREHQTLAQFDHPNIVRVYDQRQIDDAKTRLLYMQYVPGGSLQSVVEWLRIRPDSLIEGSESRTGRVLSEAITVELDRSGGFVSADPEKKKRLEETRWPEVVCRLGAELAAALDYAHQKGVLHRDVKPANVLLTADGSAKLADFNISFSSELEGATPAAYFGGSLAYMSPEQLEACSPTHARKPDELDGRSDLYSLAVLLWELLSGSRPWGAESVVGGWSTTLGEMIGRRRQGVDLKVQTPELLADPVSQQLRRILLKCLAPNPDDRYASGEELACDLRLCLQPRALRLLSEPSGGWRVAALKWPLAALTLATLLPNAFAGVFNWAYNHQAIIDHLASAQDTFHRIQLTINSVAFPIGIAIIIAYIWPVLRQLRQSDLCSSELRGSELRSSEKSVARKTKHRVLRFGKFVAILGIVEWTIAGVAYPISLHALVGGMQPAQYAHFLASLVLCGLIAAAYPFFLLSLLAVQVFYPALARRSSLDKEDAEELRSLSRQMGFFLYVAGGVPSLGMLALLTFSLSTETQNTFALWVLSIMGALGFALALLIYRTLQRDLAALVVASTPNEKL